jgi:putative addiction module component (TIGR02574 family)
MEPVDEILERALQLSYEEREKVTGRLWESLHPPGEEIAKEEYLNAWAAELERRLAEVDRGEFVEGDWRDILERARQSLKSEQPT